MGIQQIDEYLENKISRNSEYIVFTYYELRVQLNLSSEETYNFIHLVSTKLENNDYSVYRTGQDYYYNGNKKVEDNQLLVATINKKWKKYNMTFFIFFFLNNRL